MSDMAIAAGDVQLAQGVEATEPKPAKSAVILGLSRETRVVSLILAVCAMSLADLVMTLTHLTTIGMLEANPIARWIMQMQSPSLLVLWKVGTLGVAVAILLRARRLTCGEIAAWICAAVLLWLMVRWSVYLDHIDLLASADLRMVAEDSLTTFVAVDPR
jgi:hypothetical protein